MMKRIFTRKSLVALAVALFTSGNVFAGGTYVPVYGQLKVYPSGAGTVYATFESSSATPEEGQNYSEPAEQVDFKFVYESLLSATGYYYANAEAAEGWNFAGFSTEKYIDGEPVLNDSVETTSNPAYLKIESQKYDSSSLFDSVEEAQAAGYPDEPDAVHYALFSRVVPRVADQYDRFGTVSTDKAVNDIGDKVTLTAEPDTTDGNPGNNKFTYWVKKSTGEQLTENPLTVEVTGGEEYIAYFESDYMGEIEIDETGLLPWYGANEIYFPKTGATLGYLQVDSYGLEEYELNGKKVGYAPADEWAGYVEAKTPVIITGKPGKYIIKHDPSRTTPVYSLTNSFLEWSGENGASAEGVTRDYIYTKQEEYVDEEGETQTRNVKDTIPSTVKYYVLDTAKRLFTLAEDGKVAANTMYLVMLDKIIEANTPDFVPTVIYFEEPTEDEETGIKTATKKPAMKSNAYYTLGGQQVATPKENGIYIFDGKKVIFRK